MRLSSPLSPLSLQEIFHTAMKIESNPKKRFTQTILRLAPANAIPFHLVRK